MYEGELYKKVAVSTRVRLARNFQDYPFPNRLKDVEAAREMVRLVSAELMRAEEFRLYDMSKLTSEDAAYLIERNLISQDLLKHREIAAALVSLDESISVMINEEDHIREQYFMKGCFLRRTYERISGIDDIIAECIPFAYDKELGYLTACPTNLGTGLRASVMLFLPALSRRGILRRLLPQFNRMGLTVRGTFGEGSNTEGELFQVSNEVTLGKTEEEILTTVQEVVDKIVEFELRERGRMLSEDEVVLTDSILRSYGALTNCMTMDEREFMRRLVDVKLGVALGIFRGDIGMLDDLIVAMRPANINRRFARILTEEEQNIYRAEYTGRVLRDMSLIGIEERNELKKRSAFFMGGS